MKKHRTHKIKVYNWNPNGTNDVEIIKDGVVIDSMQEALFGLDIGPVDTKIMTLETCLKRVACSPVESGDSTINFFKKYFRPVMGSRSQK